jgi:hypothetical protein
VPDLADARAFWTRAGLQVEIYDAGYAFVLADGEEYVHLALRPGLDPETNPSAC